MEAEIEKSSRNPDAEIEEYRDLMAAPSSFEEGFTLRTVLGVLFISVVMVPGSMYLSLMTGGSLGAAAEWVTIILFIEIARRSFTTLRRQEIYVLFYVAASLVAAETGTFQGLLWNQYLVQSEAARQFGIAHLIPRWMAPPPGSEALAQRTFLHRDWLLPIGLLMAGMVIGRVSWFTMGYALFRLTSDVERLAFPFAPINAQGALALADSSAGQETWRWRTFRQFLNRPPFTRTSSKPSTRKSRTRPSLWVVHWLPGSKGCFRRTVGRGCLPENSWSSMLYLR